MADLTMPELIKLIASKGENGLQLIGVRLHNLDLSGLCLNCVSLKKANLEYTDLSKADLTGANAYCFAFHDGNTQVSGTQGID